MQNIWINLKTEIKFYIKVSIIGLLTHVILAILSGGHDPILNGILSNVPKNIVYFIGAIEPILFFLFSLPYIYFSLKQKDYLFLYVIGGFILVHWLTMILFTGSLIFI